ncbi:MAG: PDZ domain-containing protein [Acidimicrobiia bacterium]
MAEPDPTTVPVASARRARWTWRRRLGVAAITIAVVALVASLIVRLPYYVLSPGMSRATEDLITVRGAETFDNDGAVDFLTVSMRQVTPIEVVAAWINGTQQLRSSEEILGRLSPGENRDLDLRMMATSKDAAQYQALRRLGYDIRRLGTGAVIASVVEGGPADGSLVPGDVVTAVDGRPVELSEELIGAVSASSPGTVLVFDVEPFDESREGARPARRVEVVVGSRPDDPAKGYLGVTTFTRDLSFEFPVEVSIDSGSVGGPSAGLAFTLGILDVLTPGSITGGLSIATTGTMQLDGRVGPVGGVPQKVVAARRQGVQLMLVPASELEEARAHAGGLRIEPVETLDDALAVLATVGGGDAVLPPAPPRP